MRIIIIGLVLATLAMASTIKAQTYFEDYNEECQRALQFFDTNNNFTNESKNSGISPEFLFSIVAPEISNYWATLDFAETVSLSVLYVQAGKDYGNFSIGLFQMKPSFVEDLESWITKDSLLTEQFKEMLFYTSSVPKEIRRERIRRLSKAKWQTIYLNAFYKILEKRFATLLFDSKREKLLFYASAYNYGFTKPAEEIDAWSKQKAFPSFFTSEQYSYAEVALEFYTCCTNH